MHVKEINIENRVYSYYFDNLVKIKKLETKNTPVIEKNYKHLVIHFTRYVHSKLTKRLGLYYCELIGKIKDLMIDDYMLDNILDKIKAMINIEKFDDSKILIETYDELPGSITLKNVLILTKYDICLMVNFTHKYF